MFIDTVKTKEKRPQRGQMFIETSKQK